MDTYIFSSGFQKNWTASLLEKLDRYFFFGGNYSHIIATTSNGFKLAAQKEKDISLIEKIVKILSFILLPLVLIAFAIRYLLHKTLFFGKCFYIPTPVSKEEELILAANPEAIKKAAIKATAFFHMPPKYQQIKIECRESKPPKITFAINLDLLEKDISVKEFELPTRRITTPLLLFSSPEEEAFFKRMQEQEKDILVSEEGKRQLLRFMLDYIFIHGLTDFPNVSLGRGTYFKDKGHATSTDPNFVWAHVFFPREEGTLSKKSKLEAIKRNFGMFILVELEKLGVSFLEKISYEGVPILLWEGFPGTILSQQGYIRDRKNFS
ncbi:DUF648 domain-containing protein [Candidatus Chlamydia corallus]|uniref:DUF648 domain-containing protein n=1 Tax=Candidatus Chlamydia corallus TaxID=2038470 RepID=UPI000C2F918C|nr:DUF648 domain-containing protein [Candidatus Chlamydia corallus]